MQMGNSKTLWLRECSALPDDRCMFGPPPLDLRRHECIRARARRVIGFPGGARREIMDTIKDSRS
ncbi:protein of unknown function [Magnetospirillum sp. XM-1]|nr:protein of unknown function [Magnetospirillum sp. XM-1]